jgi:hypothetical protein
MNPDILIRTPILLMYLDMAMIRHTAANRRLVAKPSSHQALWLD